MFYLEYWGMSAPPFANDHRPEGFIPVQSAAVTMAKLRYALGTRLGAAALFGEAGVGKTQLVRAVLAEFAAAKWLVGYVPHPACAPADILELLDPGASRDIRPATTGLANLERFLARRLAEGRPVLLAVDDVHASRNPELVESLRTLLNIEENGRRALTLLLSGQPSMEKRLAAASGFDGQLSMRAVLEPMTGEETKLYMLSRLKAAGSRRGILTRQAAERVTALSRGIPRQVNRLCEMALMTGYGLEAEKIDPAIIDMAAADLGLLPPEETTFFNWPRPASESESGPESEAGEPEDILAALPVQGA